MKTTQRTPRAWKVLRDRRSSGDVGGPDDGHGGGGDDWEIECVCQHGSTTLVVATASYMDLVAWLNVLAFQHPRVIGCLCSGPNDRQIVETTLAAWRDAFGDDPDLSSWAQ